VVATAAILALVLLSLPGAAHAGGAKCNLIPTGKLKSTVGQSNSYLQRHSTDSGSAKFEVCDWGLWTGYTPKSRAEILQKGKSGNGAQVGYETWEPGAGQGGEEWVAKGYEEEIEGILRAHFRALGALPGIYKSLSPKADGEKAAGATIKATGKAKGLEVAVGCWWNDDTAKIVCLLDEEQAGKPLVAHLNALAAQAVPAFMG
jgi:hypothetical protein